jgi:hypothetical protein
VLHRARSPASPLSALEIRTRAKDPRMRDPVILGRNWNDWTGRAHSTLAHAALQLGVINNHFIVFRNRCYVRR